MIKDVSHLKEKRADLVELFEGMTKEELLNQCYLECMDAINMEERVSLFMRECTNNMSKTNYTLESLESLINEKKEKEINEFCYNETCDGQAQTEVIAEIKERAKMYSS